MAASLVPAMLVTQAAALRVLMWTNARAPLSTIVMPTRRAQTLLAALLVHATVVTQATALRVLMWTNAQTPR